jgi:hypothetical protein
VVFGPRAQYVMFLLCAVAYLEKINQERLLLWHREWDDFPRKRGNNILQVRAQVIFRWFTRYSELECSEYICVIYLLVKSSWLLNSLRR